MVSICLRSHKAKCGRNSKEVDFCRFYDSSLGLSDISFPFSIFGALPLAHHSYVIFYAHSRCLFSISVTFCVGVYSALIALSGRTLFPAAPPPISTFGACAAGSPLKTGWHALSPANG